MPYQKVVRARAERTTLLTSRVSLRWNADRKEGNPRAWSEALWGEQHGFSYDVCDFIGEALSLKVVALVIGVRASTSSIWTER